jgi:RNA polymerase sigma-70 factor (ECF subfamily)
MKMDRETIKPQLWVERYSDCMFRFALLRVNDEEYADDIVQNTFLSALKAKESFAGLSTEKTWLFGIMKNKIMDYYREKKKNQKYGLSLDEDRDPCESDFDGKGHWRSLPFDWGIDPEKAVIDKELLRIFSGCMNTLSPKLREFYVLREIEGLDSETLCSDLDITPSNLWVMLHRARNQLKKCIEVHLPESH